LSTFEKLTNLGVKLTNLGVKGPLSIFIVFSYFINKTLHNMKKTLLVILSTFFLTTIFAQKTEVKLSLNFGLMSFSGPSAENTSKINYFKNVSFGDINYTNNPYGTKAGIGYGLSADVTRKTKKGFLFGADLGYEVLRSLMTIDGINGGNDKGTFQLKATGQTFLNYHFINLFPHIGQRFSVKDFDIDISGGLDINYCLKTLESGKATDENGLEYTTSRDRKTISYDPRPRIQLNVKKAKIGIYVGYSHGVVNVKQGFVGGVNECVSRVTRLGLTYQID
jgi:hypothetical protein